MDVLCTADMCPVILNATCVFYEGNTLMYTGITTNDNLQTALQKIDAKFGDAMVGYTFTNGVYQSVVGAPVGLGGNLTTNTTIGGNFTLTFAGNVKATKLVTTGGTASQFVKGDGTLDSTAYQAAGNYITALTGDVIANGPGSVAASLATVNSNPGTYGSGSLIPVVTVDTKGRVTALTTTAINVPSGSLSFVGDVYGSGSTGSQTTLTLNNVNLNVYNSLSFLKFKVNAKGLVTGAAPVTHVDIEGVLGYVPVPETRTITINGVTHDLQTNVVFSLPGGGTVQSVSVTPGTGISASVANPTTTPNITITNTAPDQVVSITGQSGIDVTGTYPNFTISANEEGAVTSVTASAPLASSGGQTPNITITQAGASANGYLTSTDWNTFNNKVPITRTLTINGVSYDLTMDRSWTINSMVYPGAGIAVSTGTGWTTSIVDNSADWNTAYSLRLTSATAPLSIVSNVIAISQANTTTDGYLSAVDWTTFNNKQASGNYITSLTGEATASGPGAAAVTLSTPAVTGKLLTGVNITGGSVVATDTILEAFGKVQNQINSLIGGTIYKGTWNAATNTPTLASGVGTKGWYYIVSVPGTTNIDGISDWFLGDWIIFDGTAWQQVDNTDAVVSVNGYTGAVSLVSSDIPEGLTNLYYTNTRARAAISLTTLNTSGPATYDSLTGVLNIPQYQGGVTSFNTRTGAITLSSTDVTDALTYTPVPNSRTLTINGTTYDLTANRSWSIPGSMPAGGVGGQILAKIDATDYNTEWIDNFATQVKNEVKLGAALTKGTPVYVSSADGTNMIVSASSNTTEATSSKTFGLLETGGAINAQVKCVTYGLVAGLDTSAANAAGDPVWLGPNGTLLYGLANKPYAPAHMVYIGVVTRKQSNNGEIFVNVQNGFEMDELHNVSAQNPANNAILAYSTATSLWEKNTIAGVLGYTPANDSNVVHKTGDETVAGTKTFTSQIITDIQVVSPAFKVQNSGNASLYTLLLTSSNGARNVYLPDADGTIALTSNLSAYVPTTRTLTINGETYDLSANRSWTIAGGVTSFNTRTGAITLLSADVTGALGYTPANAATYVPYTGATAVLNLGVYSMFNSGTYITKTGTSSNALYIQHGAGSSIASSGYSAIGVSGTDGITFSYNGSTNTITFKNNLLTGGQIYSLPDASGTIALTSNLSSYVPTSRTLSINGTTYDLSANRSWTIAPSSAARVEQTFTATAGQATFTVTGGYVVGLVDVYVNGVKYAPADYTAIDGSTVVLNTGVVVGDIVDIINYTATIAALPTSRDVFDYTATASQTTFTVSGGYTAGLLDVYVNGVKLTPSEVTATNGTTFVLTVASIVGDQVQAIRYNSSITGISGSGTTNYVPKFTATGTIGNSAITDDGTTVTLVSRALSGTSATFSGGAITLTPTTFAIGSSTATDSNSATFQSADNNYLLRFKNAGGTSLGGFYYDGTNFIADQANWKFGSRVGIGNMLTVNSTPSINAPSFGKSLELLYRTDGSNDYAFIQAYDRTAGVYKRLDLNGTMTLNTSGNVGIGTTAPNMRLSVVGDGTYTSGDVAVSEHVDQIGTSAKRGVILGYYANGTSATAGMIRVPNNGNLIINPSGGQVLIGQTVASGGTNGIYFRPGIESGFIVTNDIALQLSRLGSTGNIQSFYSGTSMVGSVSVGSSSTSFNTTSDYRLKEDLQPVEGLEIVDRINVYNYKWKSSDERMDGVLAHELAEVLPYAVIGEKDAEKMQGVDYSKIIPVMVQAIKELKAELDLLKNK